MAQKRSRFWAWLLVSCAAPVLAHAQNAAPGAQPKVNALVDPQGVDLLSGQLVISVDLMTIGDPKQGGITFGVGSTPLETDSLDGDVLCSTTPATSTAVAFNSCAVELGTYTRTFKQDYQASTFTSQQGDGVTFTFDGAIYTLTLRDGTVAHFSKADTNLNSTARIADIHAPDGTVTTHYYKQVTQYGVTSAVKTGVGNNLGYGIKYVYSNGNTQVIGINESVEFCDLTADSCSVSPTWPRVQSSSGGWTDSRGQSFFPAIFTTLNSSAQTLTQPGRPNWTVTFDDSSRVASMKNAKGTWTYAYGTTYGPVDGSGASGSSDNNPTTYVTDPAGHTRIVVASAAFGTVLSDTNGVSQTTRYTYDGWGRLLSSSTPEGVRTSYIPDVRGNILETDLTSKDGTQTLRSYAHYPSSCTNPSTCNQPTATFDYLGNETDYGYTSQGQVNQIIGPASSGAGGLRSEEDLTYTSLFAQYFQDSSGSRRAAPSQVVRLTGTSACSTAQTCAASSTLSQSVLAYGTNNVALTSSTVGNGGATPLWATTAYTYDNFGNILTATDPRNNTTRYRWAFDHQLIGITQPNPGRAEPHPDQAVKFDYAADQWHVATTSRGTVADQSDGAWANFNVLAQQVTGYDAVDNKNSIKLVTGGVTQTLTQFVYDSVGRLQCTAVRMNTSAFASPPSACQLGAQSAYGQDRITYLQYDAADRVSSTTSAYLTSAQKIESATPTFTNDGLPQTQTDGNGNLTTYVYDGFDRLSSIQFPNPSGGGTSNASDYQQYGYDANGRITSIRHRDGSTLAFGFDGAGRLTSRSGTGLTSQSWTYDNLGRVLVASIGTRLTYTYDSLNRHLSEGQPTGLVAFQYDLNGNRTQIQWNDGSIASYTYDATNLLTNVTDPNTVLAHYKYDDLGRRTEVDHANAANTAYGSYQNYVYGSDLNLSSLSVTLADGSRNQTLNYWYNAAGQLRASTSSNALYDWGGSGNVSRPYTVDGLNRYTTSGSIGLSYDGQDNVANDTRMTYTYSSIGHLISLGNGAMLNYDAADQLRGVVTTSKTTRFVYEGNQIVGEVNNAGTLQWRYVPGAAGDEMAAWYQGSGYTGRQYPLSDRQGSVIAVANDAGGVVGINTYDESGIPASGNTGRFQFDGAPWISEIGLYHLRARDYSTTLGRFMQPDPTGYADGMNFYNYVHSDPVNGSDPLGTGKCGDDDGLSGGCNSDGNTRTQLATNVEQVVVTGTNAWKAADEITRAAQAALSRYYDDVTRLFTPQNVQHQYDNTYKVCKQGGSCTTQEVYKCLTENPAPGVSGPPVQNGQTGNVLGLGPVSFTVSPGTMTVVNSTLRNHTLYPGYVIRSVVSDSSGNIGVSNSGYGTGQLGALNTALAPWVWSWQTTFQISSCVAAGK